MSNKKNINNVLVLLLVLLSGVLLSPTAASAEKIRVIMDTDALAEVDDQHAIAYMLFSGDHFEVEGITVNRGSDGPHRTDRDQDINDHFEEAVNVVKMCNPDVPVIKGPAGNYRQIRSGINSATFDGSVAVNFIIERAHAPSDRPLIIFSIGNLTIPALALLKDPTIAPKIEIWWLGTQWPASLGENNQGADIDATDALLADPNNVTFNIIPCMSAGVTFAEIKEHFTGRGPHVSPAVNTRLGSFTCFGDFSVELFNRGVGSLQKENGRTLLDMVAATALKNNVGKFAPYEMGAPSFVYNHECKTGSESPRPGWHGHWVENSSNPRRVTMWRHPNRDAVYNDCFNTMENYVLPRQQPVKIIFDSDMGGDTDDGGCAAMLHALQNRGEVEVIACIFCTGTGAEYNEFGAGYWDAINHYYNRGDIPIGANKIPDQNREGGAKAVYGFKDVEGIAKNTALYGHRIVSSKECPGAIEVYRRALAEADDGSVTILTVGETNVIPRLLDSPSDTLSPLTGYELVARKCSRIVSMGPPYNWGIARLHDPLPEGGWGQQMLEKLPPNIPVYASPGGGQVRSGMSLHKTPLENPVRENYRICNGGTIDSETDHHSMDQCAAYFAVRGAQAGLQKLTSHGSWVLGKAKNTYNVWDSNTNNPMHFKVDVISNSDLGKAIDALMGELPVAISITSPRGGEAWEAGAKHDIKWTTKGNIPRISIAYTADGAAWKKIADSLANTGSYTWTVPKDGSATVRLKVSAIPEAVMKEVSGQIEIKEPTNR